MLSGFFSLILHCQNRISLTGVHRTFCRFLSERHISSMPNPFPFSVSTQVRMAAHILSSAFNDWPQMIESSEIKIIIRFIRGFCHIHCLLYTQQPTSTTFPLNSNSRLNCRLQPLHTFRIDFGYHSLLHTEQHP